MSTEEYARVMCAMLNIPVHKTTNQKGLTEALYQMFQLYSDLKDNQHLKAMQAQG